MAVDSRTAMTLIVSGGVSDRRGFSARREASSTSAGGSRGVGRVAGVPAAHRDRDRKPRRAQARRRAVPFRIPAGEGQLPRRSLPTRRPRRCRSRVGAGASQRLGQRRVEGLQVHGVAGPLGRRRRGPTPPCGTGSSSRRGSRREDGRVVAEDCRRAVPWCTSQSTTTARCARPSLASAGPHGGVVEDAVALAGSRNALVRAAREVDRTPSASAARQAATVHRPERRLRSANSGDQGKPIGATLRRGASRRSRRGRIRSCASASACRPLVRFDEGTAAARPAASTSRATACTWTPGSGGPPAAEAERSALKIFIGRTG